MIEIQAQLTEEQRQYAIKVIGSERTTFQPIRSRGWVSVLGRGQIT